MPCSKEKSKEVRDLESISAEPLRKGDLSRGENKQTSFYLRDLSIYRF